jgi:hypothetical protein
MTCATAELPRSPGSGESAVVQAVTVIMGIVVGLTFTFGFGNVLNLAIRLGVPVWGDSPERRHYVIIDGTLISIDRIAADRPLYSGKHKRHGVNLQVIASSDGTILWVSGQLPGSTHDTAAARIWNILAALEEARLIALGDKGYHGYDETGHQVITPYKGKNKPQSQKDANRAHARLRGPGERANAQLKQWKLLRKYRGSPHRVGRLAKAIHVLQNYEVTAGRKTLSEVISPRFRY